MSKIELFLKLAKPDDNGVSRWVKSSEFVGDYKDLALGNGGSWCRATSTLAKRYIVEFLFNYLNKYLQVFYLAMASFRLVSFASEVLQFTAKLY